MSSDTKASGYRPGPPFQRHLFIPAIVLSFVLGATRGLMADGWKVQLQGVKELGLSYAGRSIYVDDASTVWFNPAGMSRLPKTWTITVAAPVITYGLRFMDRGSTSLLGQPVTGASTAEGGQTAAVPHLYLVRKLGDRWSIGGGVNAPYGLGNDYGETWTGRYFATKSLLRVFNVSPVVAVKLGHQLSLGAGLDIQRSHAELANMIDFGSLGAANGLPLRPQSADGKIDADGDAWGVGYDLSLAWGVSSPARFGVTYRSQIEHTLKGTAHFTVPANAAPLTAGGALFKDTSATFVLPMPHEVSASASVELGPASTLVGDVTWTDWSRFQQLALAFGNPLQPALAQRAAFTDSLRGAIGVIFRPSGDVWEFRTGTLYETTPVPDATRTPRLPEANNFGVSVGASLRLSQRSGLDVSFSHLIPHDAPIQLQDPLAGQLTGSVHWRLDIVAASINWKF